MKKILAMMLTAAMMLSMGVAAMAASYDADGNDITGEENVDTVTVKITKTYKNPNNGVSPAETFDFTIEKSSVTDQAVGVTFDNMPVPTIKSVSFNEGDAGKVIITNGSAQYLCNREVEVTLPEYDGVGIYTYIIRETAGTTAGVEYFDGDIKLVVTVVQGEDGQLRIAGVHTEQNETEEKSDMFANEYYAGSLDVTKTVTGNMGDQTKDFTVKVTFNAPKGKTVGAPITYTDDGVEKSITKDDMIDNTHTVEITLKHDETVTFKNIPYGVTYSIVENDYTGEGYDKPAYRYGEDTYSGFNPAVDTAITVVDLDNVIDTANESAGITNNKGTTVDTGISVDSIPYIAMLGVVAVGGAGVVVSKKRRSED